MQPDKRKPKVLGLSASLRNARFGAGSDVLVDELNALPDRASLDSYLQDQAKICLEDFVVAGREQGLAFDELYKNLQRLKGDRGLSNSEVALAAGLWGAKNQGVDIAHCGLSRHFPPDSKPREMDELKARLREADGILFSGPVYFGDRGSIAQSFIEMIREDAELREQLTGRVYAGISVGAKRNGGQETTLIYQMLDMCNLGMLSVGNDAGTTSQYGGTGVAGDVGTMADDEYGLNTSVGTGNRFGQVANLLRDSQGYSLKRDLKVAVWLVQDRDGQALRNIEATIAEVNAPGVTFEVHDFTSRSVRRCIACDICPTHIAKDEEYRCIIKTKGDLLKEEHTSLIDTDAVLIAGLSTADMSGVASVYQRFIERTRYLRRGDYVLSNIVTAPWVVQEIGARENLYLRMMTSTLRHNTIMHKPLIDHVMDGRSLNSAAVQEDLRSFLQQARTYTVGGLVSTLRTEKDSPLYNPVGYVLSVDSERQAVRMKKRTLCVQERHARSAKEARVALAGPGMP